MATILYSKYRKERDALGGTSGVSSVLSFLMPGKMSRACAQYSLHNHNHHGQTASLEEAEAEAEAATAACWPLRPTWANLRHCPFICIRLQHLYGNGYFY